MSTTGSFTRPKYQIQDFAYWLIAALSAGFLSRVFASNFETPLFANPETPFIATRLFAAMAYLVTATALSWIYYLKYPFTNRLALAIGAIIMLFTASVVYSIVRQDLILLVFPSVFCVPGAIFGACLASLKMTQIEPIHSTSKNPLIVTNDMES